MRHATTHTAMLCTRKTILGQGWLIRSTALLWSAVGPRGRCGRAGARPPPRGHRGPWRRATCR
eukprot:6901716-Lingulodinium_polyedra.AAC.1